jgi:microsomal dipeptidase-like Zn-dependent dipeptidase
MWFDAHLDLAYLAVSGRDMLRPVHGLADRAGPHPPAAVTLPALAEGNVRLALATIFTEPVDASAPPAAAAPGAKPTPEQYPAGDVGRAYAVGRAQLEVYLTWRDLGRMTLSLRDVLRVDAEVGEIRGGMGVAQVVPASVARRVEDADRAVVPPRDARPIEELGAPARTTAALLGAGVRTVADAHTAPDKDLLKIPGVGRAGVRAVREAIHTQRLALHAGVLIENADPIREPDELAWWVERGVVAIGLAWGKPSRYAGGNGTDLGLTDLGRVLVREMDRLGVVHDASHLSDRSMRGLLDATDRMVVASHSNCRGLLGGGGMGENQRHLHDDWIREIARRGGVIGLNLYGNFLSRERAREGQASTATLHDAVRHVQHICDLTGSRAHVGLGSDMDGGFSAKVLPAGVRRPLDLVLLAEELRSRGFNDDDIAAFAHRNWARVFGG